MCLSNMAQAKGRLQLLQKFQRLRKCQKRFCNCEMSERGVEGGHHGSLQEKMIDGISGGILNPWFTGTALGGMISNLCPTLPILTAIHHGINGSILQKRKLRLREVKFTHIITKQKRWRCTLSCPSTQTSTCVFQSRQKHSIAHG